jgi:hypothetical protein
MKSDVLQGKTLAESDSSPNHGHLAGVQCQIKLNEYTRHTKQNIPGNMVIQKHHMAIAFMLLSGAHDLYVPKASAMLVGAVYGADRND